MFYNFTKHIPFNQFQSLLLNLGIVTRCPLELKMKKKREGEEWYGKISYQSHEEEITDPADVEKKIRKGTILSVLKPHYQKKGIDGATEYFQVSVISTSLFSNLHCSDPVLPL